LLLSIGVTKLNLTPNDFWKLTFAEWWAIYNAVFDRKKPMSLIDVNKLEEAWINGNTRRTGDKT
jgi:hypothetical protein